MSALRVTVACGDYDRTHPLVSGRISAGGVDLNVLPLSNAWARHQRMLLHEEFDACELSTSSFLMDRDRRRRFVAVPVFPYRMFRHRAIWCHAKARIRTPEDLRGKRIGVGMYQITAAIWIRGFLKEDYGVLPEDVVWVTELPELMPPLGSLRAKIERLATGKSAERLFLEGELDAYIAVEGVPAAFRGRDDIHPLFADYKAVETDYFRRTGFFPIMHTIVIKACIADAHPWLPVTLMDAFRAAKKEAAAHAAFPRSSSLAWCSAYQDDERKVLGPDPFPYNWPDNRAAIEAICRYAHDQGLVSRKFQPEELFAASTLDYPESGGHEGGRIQSDV